MFLKREPNMLRGLILATLFAALLEGCQRAPAEVELTVPPPPPAATGPRFVVIKAEGLSCAECAAALQAALEANARLSQVETFAPSPYCRFYVEDGSLDVAAMLNSLPDSESTLAGWTFVRGG